MIKKKIKIYHELGINARFATALVNVCMNYSCKIKLSVFKRVVDFKSIMGVMSLGVYCGSTVEVICDGTDEEIAMDNIVKKFNELKLGKEV